jgi:hypothetical protein
MGNLALKVLHIFGVLLVFFALGGLTLNALSGGTADTGRGRKVAGATHGLALLLILFTGFAMIVQLNLGFPIWVWIKIALWLAIGGMLGLIRSKPQHAGIFWILIPILGTFAGYLAIYKPW